MYAELDDSLRKLLLVSNAVVAHHPLDADATPGMWRPIFFVSMNELARVLSLVAIVRNRRLKRAEPHRCDVALDA
jgi:hypothetical protein